MPTRFSCDRKLTVGSAAPVPKVEVPQVEMKSDWPVLKEGYSGHLPHFYSEEPSLSKHSLWAQDEKMRNATHG